ncbi:MAG: hypothetical protein JNL25_13795 [Rhodospirillaceae bacterium]|nr:hypothetical protein [Rhodospirillaceae bacterium]
MTNLANEQGHRAGPIHAGPIRSGSIQAGQGKIPFADRFGMLLAILAAAVALFLAAGEIRNAPTDAGPSVESLADYEAKNLSP